MHILSCKFLRLIKLIYKKIIFKNLAIKEIILKVFSVYFRTLACPSP